MRRFVSAILLLCFSVGYAGCAAMDAFAPGVGSAMMSAMKREKIQEVNGVPLSAESLQVTPDARAKFSGVKKIAVIGFELNSNTPFMNNVAFNYGAGYKRTLVSYEKAFKKRGFEVVSQDALRKDKVYKTYDPKAALAAYIDSSGSMIKTLLTIALPSQDGKAGDELMRAVAGLYLEAYKAQIGGSAAQLTAHMGPAVKKVADLATDKVMSLAKEQTQPPDGATLADRVWNFSRSLGGDPDARLYYLPLSNRTAMIERTGAMQHTPTAWAKSEPRDEFVANLAKSLHVDTIVLIQTCMAWDGVKPAVGFCTGGAPAYIVFYDNEGRVMQTPFLMTPMGGNTGLTGAEIEKMKKEDPLVKELLQLTEKAQNMSLSIAVMNFLNTLKSQELLMRTELSGEDAKIVADANLVYRAVALTTIVKMAGLAIDQKKQQQSFVQTVDQETFNRAFKELSSTMQLLAWQPSEKAMTQMDNLADRVVGAVLQPMGK